MDSSVAPRSACDHTILKETTAIIMAGGQGERLYPLTKNRAKPAVPFGGIYRIIDFTLSNCINSGVRRIHILTQYKSLSLDRHIQVGWAIFNYELGEFINIIPPQQRMADRWYAGTADAVYQNIYTLERERPKRVLLLSGDHVYKMDYGKMLAYHTQKAADLTIACVEVGLENARTFGVAQIDERNRIIGFQEKVEDPTPMPHDPSKYLASMGVYVFNTEALVRSVVDDAKTDSSHDFGKNIIPKMIMDFHQRRNSGPNVFAYNFNDENRGEVEYWRDIGAIDAYWEANMDLVEITPVFNLYDKEWPIRTYQEQQPPAKFVFAEPHRDDGIVSAIDSIISSGCIISGARVHKSILSPDVRVESHADISASILMSEVRIGHGARIRKAIIDKRVVVPDHTEIGCNPDEDRKRFMVTEGGVTVVPEEAVW